MTHYDFLVVGGGIAGISIAELLQRSGKKVLLLEAKDSLFSDASSQQQSWFHTGALYAPYPISKYFETLVRNIDNIVNYYGGFKNMNLRYGSGLNRSQLEGWFTNETIDFIYTSPLSKRIPVALKPLWALSSLLAKSRLAWLEGIDRTRAIGPQIGLINASIRFGHAESHSTFQLDFGKVGSVMASQDTTLQAEKIAEDLVRSFVTKKGVIKLASPVEKIEKQSVVTKDGSKYEAEHIIVAAGQGTTGLSKVKTNTFKSPLLVIKPALSNTSWINVVLPTSNIINHIRHVSKDGDYSVFGNNYRYGLDEILDEEEIRTNMIRQIEKIYRCTIDPNRTHLYFGYKTEWPKGNGFWDQLLDFLHLPNPSEMRNYLYGYQEGENCLVVLPGKLTLSFSLAVSVCEHFGIVPSTHVEIDETIPIAPISATRHRAAAGNI